MSPIEASAPRKNGPASVSIPSHFAPYRATLNALSFVSASPLNGKPMIAPATHLQVSKGESQGENQHERYNRRRGSMILAEYWISLHIHAAYPLYTVGGFMFDRGS